MQELIEVVLSVEFAFGVAVGFGGRRGVRYLVDARRALREDSTESESESESESGEE